MNTCRSLVRTASALGLLLAGSAYGVTFQNVPLEFSHQPSTRLQTLINYFSDGVMDVPTEYVPAPFKPYGVPGVAIFDYDTDGDLDIYVTNGPGGANGLFSNQLSESHSLGFVDVAEEAGVALTAVDTQGVCYGDIDNDSDPDLLVLGFNGAHHLFENDGDGTFTDITASSHIAGQNLNGVSCAMGDVNNDGLLDIAIANAFDFTTMTAITSEPVVHNQPNSLFLNQGGNTFSDVSTTSGIRNKVTGADFPADLTWSVALVDYDEDGDVDVFFGNDMRAATFQNTFISLFRNDGSGHFTDVTGAAGFPNGSWRGLAFGDINCDGRIDLFATNLGDYIFFPGQAPVGAFSSAWFLQQANGSFARQSPGALKTVPQGWGNSMIDYDNDGDLDLVAYGNQDDTLFWDNSNGGVILNNTGNCSATFTWDQAALGDPTRHVRHNIEGLATGDLNNDGFDDIVSVSSFNADPSNAPLAPIFSNPLNSVFDVAAFAVYVTVPTSDPNKFQFTGPQGVPGELFVEINSGNKNNWAKVKLVGTAGITTDGQSNRDGIGAVVSYTRPVNKNTLSSVTRPVQGGNSMLSQNSPELIFGLDGGRRGMVEVLWPGGTKNRLYGVRLGERVTIPEIPCSYDANWHTTGDYVTCVVEALDEIREAGLIDGPGHVRYFLSALHAYLDVRGLPF